MSGDLLGRIVRTQAGYARCIDNGLLEQWPGFFTEKCLYVVTTADNHREGLDAGLIWADTRAMLTDRVTSLRDANIYERHTYRHLLGQPYLLGELGDTVESETPFLVARVMRDGATDVFATGRYLDTFRVGEDLLLTRRVVVCDSSRIDTLLALPL